MEETRRRQAEKELIRLEAARRAEEEHRKGQRLETAVAACVKAGQIRAFLEAATELSDQTGSDPDLVRWLEWARGYADGLDPLTSSGLLATKHG